VSISLILSQLPSWSPPDQPVQLSDPTACWQLSPSRFVGQRKNDPQYRWPRLFLVVKGLCAKGLDADDSVLDARYEKVRENGVIRSRAVLVAIGIDWEGRRQMLGVEMANRKSSTSWREEEERARHWGRQREQLVHHRQKLEAQGRSLLINHGLSAPARWWRPQSRSRLGKLLPAWILSHLELYRPVLSALGFK
jgi:hypothetical protein